MNIFPITFRNDPPMIFISYRHDDSYLYSFHLYKDLENHFRRRFKNYFKQKALVVRDENSFETGEDFRESIKKSLNSCAAFITIIGDKWFITNPNTGQRRIDEEKDILRNEIATALSEKIPVIPILVENAKTLEEVILPKDIEELAFKKAIPLRKTDWDNDVNKLIKRLEQILSEYDDKVDERAASATKRSAEQGENTTQILPARTTSGAKYLIGKLKNHKPGFVILSVLLLALVGLGYWFLINRSADTSIIESIAVLPFVNESGNADAEYLSDGMTDTLIGSLSQLPKLKVQARSSVFRYKGKETDAQTIGKELNVQAILNGRVIQRGDALTLYLELVDAQTGNRIWGEQYNRKTADLVSVQSEIARDVANKLRVKLSGAERQKLTKNYTENAEAYQLYLKGRYYWYKFPAKEFEKSGYYFQQAITVDPNYALAYAGLSEYYGYGAANGFLPPTSENWSKSEVSANKALALDDALPNAYNALAGVKQLNNDRAGAERDLKLSIELDPNYAEGLRHYAMYLIEVGRFEEALVQMKKVLELEPLSVPYNRNLAMILYGMREYDRTVEQHRKTLELDPNDAYTHELLGNAYEQKGMLKEAVAEWGKALRLTEDNETATMLERTFIASGFNAAVHALWQKKLEQFNEKSKRGDYVPAMNYALAYTRLANKEQAFAWLTKAEQEHNRLKYELKRDPIYDNLRDDPRFQDLLRGGNF